jgi:hypothetical protein
MNTTVHARAEIEHRTPRVRLQQLRDDEAAKDGADRIADRHDRHAQVPALQIRELRSDRVDRGKESPDAEARDHTPRRQLVDVVDGGGHEHAEGHQHEAAEGQWPPPDLVCERTEDERAEGHAPQLHREHEAERRAIQPPLLENAGSCEADGQHIEPIQPVQTHRDSHGDDLHDAHGCGGDGCARIVVHRLQPPRSSSLCCNRRRIRA